jgi:hypothetical protein
VPKEKMFPQKKMFLRRKKGVDKRMWPKGEDGPKDNSLGRRWCRNPTLKECEDETHTPKIGA